MNHTKTSRRVPDILDLLIISVVIPFEILKGQTSNIPSYTVVKAKVCELNDKG